MNTDNPVFDHERLFAYRRSIEFAAWSSELLDALPTKLSVCGQLDRASTSVPLNIAEGNGKYTPPCSPVARKAKVSLPTTKQDRRHRRASPEPT